MFSLFSLFSFQYLIAFIFISANRDDKSRTQSRIRDSYNSSDRDRDRSDGDRDRSDRDRDRSDGDRDRSDRDRDRNDRDRDRKRDRDSSPDPPRASKIINVHF